MSNLTELGKEASRCVKCGTCLADCPLYAETLSEATTARGKMSLVESLPLGDIQFTAKLNSLLTSCLVCNSCGESCPNKVKVEEIILEARKELSHHRGLPFAKKLLFRYFLTSPRTILLFLRAGSLLRGLLLKKIPRESGLHLRFPLPLIDRKRLIPDLPKKFFFNSHPPLVKAHDEKKRVGYFAGCATNYLFPRLGDATLRVLNKHGISVCIPHDLKCCGLTAFGSGDWHATQKLALANIESFEQFNLDTIVTTCGSCAAALKIFYPRIFKDADADIQEKVVNFSNKIMDISQFLTQEPGILSKVTKLPKKQDSLPIITYHDPCHLNRTLGITQEPREILKSLSSLAFEEMNNACRCCGMGGSFNITHYELSLNIVGHKLDALEAMGAQIVATGCSGCMLQFMDGIHQRGLDIKVVHLIEALEMG
jgi:glycolate oxidase iron-sulfur subunit